MLFGTDSRKTKFIPSTFRVIQMGIIENISEHIVYDTIKLKSIRRKWKKNSRFKAFWECKLFFLLESTEILKDFMNITNETIHFTRSE